MKRVITIVVCILLAVGLVATVNDGEYIGLTGVLQRLSNVDFSFSDTLETVMSAFDNFENVGIDGTIWEKVELAVRGLFDLVRVPFVAIKEVIELIRDIFDLLFALVGIF